MKENVYVYLTSRLQEAIFLMNREECSCLVNHVYRESNRCTYKLANVNINRYLSFVDLPTPLNSLILLLDGDSRMMYIPHYVS